MDLTGAGAVPNKCDPIGAANGGGFPALGIVDDGAIATINPMVLIHSLQPR